MKKMKDKDDKKIYNENRKKNESEREYVRMNRRRFLQGTAAAGVLLAGGAFLTRQSWWHSVMHKAQAVSGGLDVSALRQMMTKDPATSRRIMWESAEVLASPAVEYRQKGAAAGEKQAAVDESFTDDDVTRHQYAAAIEGLTPGTSYEYRVVSGDRAGSWQPLQTPKEDGSFLALIFPDSQSNGYSDWHHLVSGAAERNKSADFFINMGDLVDNGEDHTQWEAWFDAVQELSERVPLAPLMGNHETYDLKWQVRLPEAYLHYFDVPANGSAQFEKYYYSFDYGLAHFMVINTQWDETEEFQPGLLDEQLEWLRRDAAASQKPWKIALLHKDVLQYRIKNRPERQEGISDVGEAFMPLFDELGIDAVFTAHLHTYRDRGRLYHMRPADKGPLYILTGVAGNVRYPDLWVNHAFDKVVAPQPETDNYLTLAVTPTELTVCCFLPDGTEIDRTSIRKA